MFHVLKFEVTDHISQNYESSNLLFRFIDS